MSYTCYLISNKPHLFSEIKNSIYPEPIQYFDGSGIGSFSRLVNCCVEACPTEIVIMCSDKIRPIQEDVKKLIELLDLGYAFVGLYRFGFFGFKKELFRKIGMMDERYTGGGYEDDDIYLRIKEANLAMYLSHEVNYISGNSSWNSEECRQHFINKWGDVEATGIATRKLEENTIKYNLGLSTNSSFLSWNHTKIHAKKVKRYLDIKII